jgi:hypothetical protein
MPREVDPFELRTRPLAHYRAAVAPHSVSACCVRRQVLDVVEVQWLEARGVAEGVLAVLHNADLRGGRALKWF